MGCGDLRLLNGRAHRCVEGRKRPGLVNLTEPLEIPLSRADQFEHERRRLFGIAYRMLGSRADAEDVVQDAYPKTVSPVSGIRS